MAKKRSDSIVRGLLRTTDPLSDEACGKLLSINRESRLLDFKRSFDPGDKGEWCELVKDLVAMANTDGGYIIIGAKDDGTSSGSELEVAASIDQATLVDKIGMYTDVQPDEVNLRHFVLNRKERVIFHVGKADAPIVFCRLGAYQVAPKKHKTAFQVGTVYFRHGSKSEPARQADIQRTFDSMLARRRREILAGVAKVIRAPSDHQVLVIPNSVQLTTDSGVPRVRLTDDPSAPAVRGVVGSGKYDSLQEELATTVRTLQTDSKAYAAAAQLWRFYAQRLDLTNDEDQIRCLLVSSMYGHCPFYFWAYRLGKAGVAEVCSNEVQKDAYPGIQVTVRLAHAISGNSGRRVLEQIGQRSQYPSAKALAKRLLPTVGMPWRVWEEYKRRAVTIQTASDRKQYRLSRDDLPNAELLIGKALTDDSNRDVVKHLDALVYGTQLARNRKQDD